MSLTALETITLAHGDARVVIAPARGGMVTRFDVGDEPVLFLDAASLADTTKNVRGGIPVLFPSPGPLAGERFSRDGKSGSMKQHGFARQEAWAVVGHTERDVTLELTSNDATRAQYPWDFSAMLHYVLADAKLTIEMMVRNTGTTTLPFAFGVHPYFHVPDAEKAQARIETDATRGFDNVTKKMVDVRGPIDLTQKEVDLHLVDHKPDTATLRRARDSIVITADADVGNFGRWVVWTLAGKDFVCLEPWTAPADALNTGDHLLNVLSPSAAMLSVTIACVKRS